MEVKFASKLILICALGFSLSACSSFLAKRAIKRGDLASAIDHMEDAGFTEAQMNEQYDIWCELNRAWSYDKWSDQAMANVGICYEFGLGKIDKDRAAAINWYRQSAGMNNSKAKERLTALGVEIPPLNQKHIDTRDVINEVEEERSNQELADSIHRALAEANRDEDLDAGFDPLAPDCDELEVWELQFTRCR